ncbi:hypothetical protein MMC17_008194 [Xylographa soralifera]|nr:hypothetical protein [Xylographa soralifera]
MSLLARNFRAPQCFACIRQVLGSDLSLPLNPFRTQVRGKKKIRLPTTINVKLLRDVRGYGRRGQLRSSLVPPNLMLTPVLVTGSIVPVAPGRMRNIWYPSKRAEYMTDAQLKTIPDVVIERDFTFGMEQATEGQETGQENPVNIQIKLLSPDKATQLIDTYVPKYLEFYRPAISSSETEAAESSPPRRNSSTAVDLAESSEPQSKPKPIAIYGSVSTADIVASIKGLMTLKGESAESVEAARVVLNPEDIRIEHEDGLQLGEERDRIKTLGNFTIYILVKGGDVVRRTVKVKAQE